MSARQLNRLAKAKGLDHLLGGTLNEELDASEGTNDSEEDEPFSRGGVVSASAFGDDSDESSSSSEEEQDSSSDSDGSSDNTGSNKDKFSAANAVATATASSSSASSSSSSSASHVALTTTSPVISRNDAALETTPPPSSATPSKPQKSADPVEASPTAASPTVTSSKGRTAVRENDDQYLDNVISELASAAAAAAAAAGGGGSAQDEGGVTSSLARLLRCDPRCLKLDLELRRKFGAGVGGGDRENGAAGGRGGRARRPRRGMMMRGGNAPASLALKRLVVSAPKEDWPKPPSLVGGGLGMKRCEAPAYLPPWQRRAHSGAEWFVFERSSSLEQLQRRFEAIQGMHDPNLLGAFASQAPYHADALLQLAMVFAHTGQMDRASEFVGRSLYVLESSSMEAFRPLEGACRLDATLEVNKTYLAALFRHMQMAGMVGGARTALEVGRLLLSVDPLGDPMGCLLALDSHALACYEGKFILELYESKLPIGYSPSDLSRTADTPAAAAAAATWSAYGVSRLQGTSENVIFEGPGVTVQDLPGLSMSVCLATLDNGGGTTAAREAMAETLLRFPVMLEPLLEKCGVSPRSTTHPQDWRSVMQHPHFAGARARIPTGHVLVHLASIYAERGGELWKHERAMELLYDGAGIALQGLGTASTLDAQATNGESGAPGSTSAAVAASGTAAVAATSATAATATATSAAAVTATPAAGVPAAQAFMPGKRPSASEAEILRRAYGVGSPIHKYLDLEVSDFAETFALLPQDANILNPRLMGPNFMNERVRMHMPMAAGGGGGGGGMLDVDVARVMQAFGGNGGGVMGWRGRREVGRRPQGNLDPAAPLAQLFWQTLMPWNTFPTPSNPTPPPPPWL